MPGNLKGRQDLWNSRIGLQGTDLYRHLGKMSPKGILHSPPPQGLSTQVRMHCNWLG